MRPHAFAFIPRVLLCLTLFVAQVAGQPTSPQSSQATDQLAASRQLDAFIAEVMALKMTAGMAIAVVQNDRVAFAKGYGVTDVDRATPVTPDTQFYIASTTKALTALATLVEEQSGRLNLDAPVSQYVPGMKLHSGLDPNGITVMDLLTHSHGITGSGPVVERTAYSGVFTYPQLFRLMALHPPARRGRQFQYSNIGYVVAGFVLDPRREEGWKEVVDRDVLRPLGMTSTTAYMSRTDKARLAMPHAWGSNGLRRISYGKTDTNMHAAGGHVSTVNDMSKMLIAEINGGRIGNKQIFPPALIERSQAKQVDQDRTFSLIKRDGWGVGWDLGLYEGERIVSRFGGFPGFQSHASFVPARRVAVLGFVNTAAPAAPTLHLVALHAYEIFLGMDNLPQRRARMLDRIRELRATALASESARQTSQGTTPSCPTSPAIIATSITARSASRPARTSCTSSKALWRPMPAGWMPPGSASGRSCRSMTSLSFAFPVGPNRLRRSATLA